MTAIWSPAGGGLTPEAASQRLQRARGLAYGFRRADTGGSFLFGGFCDEHFTMRAPQLDRSPDVSYSRTALVHSSFAASFRMER